MTENVDISFPVLIFLQTNLACHR